jgi:hypothetical protein
MIKRAFALIAALILSSAAGANFLITRQGLPVIIPAGVPVNSMLPGISGSPTVGQTLTAPTELGRTA